MVWFKRSPRSTRPVIILVVTLLVALVINLPTLVQAQLNPPSLSNKLPNQWENSFSPPPPTGNPIPISTLGGSSRYREEFPVPSGGPSAPVNTQGGATRGPQCIEGNNSLVALVPASGIGTTMAEYPTFFWYMPQTRAASLKFVLQDANNQEIYSTEYPLAKSHEAVTDSPVSTPGIKSLTLPSLANLAPLEIGQNYSWQLTLICDSSNQGEDILAKGGIQRVNLDPTLALRLQRATPQQRVALYADARVWYETLDTLLELRRDRPNDKELTDAWTKLLTSVGLQAVAQEPLF